MTISSMLRRYASRSAPLVGAARLRPTSSSAASTFLARRSFFSSAGAGAGPDPSFLPQISDSLLPIILGIVLYARKDSDAAPSDGLQLEGPFEVKSSGKGLGAFATRDIPRGEILLSEQPLVVWDTSADGPTAKKLVDQLTPEARKQFFNLANALPNSDSLEPALGVRGTNGFNVQLPPVPRDMASTQTVAQWTRDESPSHATMVFPRVARINHSCLPNADHAIDWSTLQMTVYATTDIQAGQEINIEYQPGLIQRSRAQRRAQLYDSFGFGCACAVCDQGEAQVALSDGRRAEIDRLVSQLADDGAAKRRGEVTAGLKRMRELLQAEGYQAMPEFNDANVSKAFAFWSSMPREGQ